MTDDQHPDGPDMDPDDLDDEALRRAAEARDAARTSEAEALDERLSAFLDSELQLGEERPDLDDPRLARRIGELSSVSEAIGARVPPVPPEVVDAQIARALEELPTAADAPTSLTAARARRRGWADRLPALGAAAAVVLVAFGFVALSRSGGSDDDSGDSADAVAEFSSRGDGGDDAGDAGAIAAAEAGPDADESAELVEVPPETEAAAAGGDTALAESDDAADGEAADEEEEAAADEPELAAPVGVPIELSDDCQAAVLSSVGGEAIDGAIEVVEGPAEVIVRFADGSIVTALVDLGLCEAADGVEVDPVLELVRP